MNAPIIILGAPRSGTKLLRGILASHPEIAAFPSEINFVWRYGNRNLLTDELQPEHARPEVIKQIRKEFENLSERHNGARIVEKTCANTLRVGFVHKVFPDAYFVHIVRDGRACAESARRIWQTGPGLSYYLQKFRSVSLRDALYYAPSYVRYRMRRDLLPNMKSNVAGPRFSGVQQLMEQLSFIELCGIQWRACVHSASTALECLPPSQVVTVRYKDLVHSPVNVSKRLFEQVGLTFPNKCHDYVNERVRTSSVEKWKLNLSDEDLERLLPHIQSKLIHYGYKLSGKRYEHDFR